MSILMPLIDKNQHLLNSMQESINDRLGSSSFVKEWKMYSDYLPPGHFVEISDWITNEIHRKSISTEVFWQTGSQKHDSQSLHENEYGWYHLHRQHILLAINASPLSNEILKTCCISTYRSLISGNGKAYQVKMLSKPILNQGRVVSKFISWYVPLTEYEGEPLKCVWQGKGLKNVSEYYSGGQAKVLDLLPFTERERLVLQMMAKGKKNADITEKLDISQRTLEKYNQKILCKSRELFVLNNFTNARAVCCYLEAMNLFSIDK